MNYKFIEHYDFFLIFHLNSDPKLIYQRRIQHDASANKIKLVIPNEVFDSPYGDVEAISVLVEQDGDVIQNFTLNI